MTLISGTSPHVAQPVLPSVQRHVQRTIEELFGYLAVQGNSDYLGEQVSQLEHSLQCAHLATMSNADAQTILAALLHDVGRFISLSNKDDMPAMLADDGKFVGRLSHEVVGERYLRALGFGEKVCQLVGGHVQAKRYLTAVDKRYYDSLSKTSKTTLKYQGGPFNDEQVREAQKDPWLAEKLEVRKWDDEAKVAGVTVPGLDAYRGMAINCLEESVSSFTLHNRTYRLPTCPTVAICVDGFDPTYLAQGISDGILPNLAWISQSGFAVTADVAMPTFTNPNNCSIITGAPTAIHGIAGNFYLEPSTGEEKLVLDDSLLRGSTILEQMSLRGVRVAAVTAKDKLRRIIQHGLSAKRGDICFSSEYANQCTLGDNGITDVEAYVGRPAPPQYSGDLSLFVLDAGIKLLRDNRADLFYLTLSDYVQHKHAPGSKEANDFLVALDEKIGQLIQLGAVVGITGDHGMSDKSLQDGTPNILFVQEELEKRFGPKCARVICPITDPFVRHHGALGSFVRIHINSNLKHRREEMLVLLRTFPQVQVALIGEEAAARWEMPLDREADIVVVSIENAVLGSKKAEHDLNQLKGHRLRSHGGLSEQAVPLMMSNKGKAGLAEEKGARHWRNFDVFDLILNCVEEAA